MYTVEDIQNYFIEELEAKRFVTDKTGVATIEMLGANFIANKPSIFGTPNDEYIKAELNWYEKQSTNINDIYGLGYNDKSPPIAWRRTADAHGNINSNYGHLVYSKKYYNQYRHAFNELWLNSDSRRAQMIYNRPSIWIEYNENGKSDFICTNAQTFYIRDNKLHMVSQMRSNDIIFGYKNDYAWAQHLMDNFVQEWNSTIEYFTYLDAAVENNLPIEKGQLIWQVMNLHCYDRHFNLVKLDN
jgi:thymidylate synthase